MNKLPAKRLVIPLFILNGGCPNRCAFCRRNGKDVQGEKMSAADLEEVVSRYLAGARNEKKACTQIAFYGGNFTGLPPAEQERLLKLAGAYVRNRLAHSLRISTRPDFMGDADVERLRRLQVATVEIGAQSMSDEVLRRSRRGHASADVARAVERLKDAGFETCLHLMAGLPGDTRETFFSSVERVIALKPHMVRIHPTLVFPDTELAAVYRRGEYRPLSIAEAIELCLHALDEFEAAGIPVVRIGLQPDVDMEQPGAVLAGPFHPAFRSLVEEARFFRMATRLLDASPEKNDDVTFLIAPADDSYFRGLNNGNMGKLRVRLPRTALRVLPDPCQEKGSLTLVAGADRYETDKLSAVVRTRPGG